MDSNIQSSSDDRALIISVCVVAASYSLLYYDYMLTFSEEVDRFWNTAPKLTVVSILYIANRFLALGGPIPMLVVGVHSDFQLTEKLCHRLQSYHQWIELFTQAVVGSLLIMRTYALYNRHRAVLAFFAILLGASGAVSMWAMLRSEKGPSEDTVVSNGVVRPLCSIVSSTSQGRGLAGAWMTMLLLDTSVFVMTLTKALQARRVWQGVLLGIMIRDGTLYFGVLVAINIVNVTFFLGVKPVLKGSLTPLINVVSSILVARLMLNLRDPNVRGDYQPPTVISAGRVLFGESSMNPKDFGMTWLSASAYGRERPPDQSIQIEPEEDNDQFATIAP